MNEQLDPQIVNLAKSIRQTESGNSDVMGKSGEMGAYQFTRPTWEAYSKKFGITVPLDQATKEQQNEVVYKQIKEWKDKGHNIGEIASMWNAGGGRPNAYKENFKGVNKYGVSYDTPAYAQKVAETYQALKKQTIEQAPTGGYVSEGKVIEPTGNMSKPNPGLLANLGQGNYGTAGKQALSWAERGMNKITSPFVGLAAIPTQAIAKIAGLPDPFKDGMGTNIDGGKGISVSPIDLKSKGMDYFNAGMEIATVSGLGGLLKSALGTSILKNPNMIKILDDVPGGKQALAKMNPAEISDYLHSVRNSYPPSYQALIDDAIVKLEPAVKKIMGTAPGLIKKVLKSGVVKGMKKVGGGTAKLLGLKEIYDIGSGAMNMFKK
jgi:hypothetical protein